MVTFAIFHKFNQRWLDFNDSKDAEIVAHRPSHCFSFVYLLWRMAMVPMDVLCVFVKYTFKLEIEFTWLPPSYVLGYLTKVLKNINTSF